MKKRWMIFVTILGCSLLNANLPEKVEALTESVMLEDDHAYFLLSDGSFWKAIAFHERIKNPYEWWNCIPVIPSVYQCLPKEWSVGSRIEVYPKCDDIGVAEFSSHNPELIAQTTHLLVNAATGKVLCAIALDPAETLAAMIKIARQEGYQAGYNRYRIP